LTDPELEGSDLEREAGTALSSPLDGLTKVMAGLEQSLAALTAGEPVALGTASSAATAGEARSGEAAAGAGPSGGAATGELEAGQPLAGPVEPAAAEVATGEVAEAASVPGPQGPP